MFEQIVIEYLLWNRIDYMVYYLLAEDQDTQAQGGDEVYLRSCTLGSVQFT